MCFYFIYCTFLVVFESVMNCNLADFAMQCDSMLYYTGQSAAADKYERIEGSCPLSSKHQENPCEKRHWSAQYSAIIAVPGLCGMVWYSYYLRTTNHRVIFQPTNSCSEISSISNIINVVLSTPIYSYWMIHALFHRSFSPHHISVFKTCFPQSSRVRRPVRQASGLTKHSFVAPWTDRLFEHVLIYLIVTTFLVFSPLFSLIL